MSCHIDLKTLKIGHFCTLNEKLLVPRGGSRAVYKVCTNLSEFFPKIFLRVYIVNCKWFLTLWVQNLHSSNDFFLSGSCLRMKWHYCNDLQFFLDWKPLQPLSLSILWPVPSRPCHWTTSGNGFMWAVFLNL